MAYALEPLDTASIEPYRGLTYPAVWPLAPKLAADRGAPLVAIGARGPDGPAALVVAEYGAESRVGVLTSLYTVPGHRGRGLASGLLARLEATLAARGCRELRVLYERPAGETTAADRLLARRGFPPPAVRGLVGRCQGADLRRAPWVERAVLPAAFASFPWAALSPAEREALRERERSAPWYPAVLSPFSDELRLEPLNSLGLRHRGEVVGWQVNHRIAPDTIRYTAMFVREDLQPFGLAIPLMAEAIRRHVDEGPPGVDRATFVVPVEAAGMRRFVEQRMRPYLASVTDSLEAVKPLPSSPAPTPEERAGPRGRP
jgi:GNAT superfamily N-acetyltransferase